MDAVKKWMLDNQVFSGMAVAVLTMLGGVVAYFYKRRKQLQGDAGRTVQTGRIGAGNIVNVQGPVENLAVGAAAPVSLPAEDVRVDVKGVTPAGRRFSGYVGLNDNYGRQVFQQEAWTPVPACLKIVCHNLTETPVLIDQILLLNADSNQAMGRFDGNPTRLAGLDFKEIHMNLPLEMPPALRGRINITTVRGGAFDSKPFEWGKQ
jgi:hypothetical protein